MTGQTAAERIAELKRERDTARGIAVALEQRLAYTQRIARKLLAVHAEVTMDTPEDRDLHTRAVATFALALDPEAGET